MRTTLSNLNKAEIEVIIFALDWTFNRPGVLVREDQKPIVKKLLDRARRGLSKIEQHEIASIATGKDRTGGE